MIIKLTYPHKDLNPNARLHWGGRASRAKVFKKTWHTELVRYAPSLKGKTEFTMSFAPPDKHIRDVDNCIASLKACLDALALVTGVDDSKFRITYPREFSRPVTGGAIYIEVAV